MTKSHLLLALATTTVTGCTDWPCPDEQAYHMQSIAIEFRDSVTYEVIPPDSSGYSIFQVVELGHTEPLLIDTIWRCNYGLFGTVMVPDRQAIILPLNLNDTISTFVLTGSGKKDTVQATYHPELVYYGDGHKCGYQALIEPPCITQSTLPIRWQIANDCFLILRLIVSV
jgi:hypothetical protein